MPSRKPRFLALAGTLALGSTLSAAESIQFLPAPTPPPADVTIPVVKDAADPSWYSGKPTFEMNDDAGLRAVGFLASTATELIVRIDVTDVVHINEQTYSRDAWNGDSITISLDARGDGPGKSPTSTVGVFGPDDTLIRLGLTPTGPMGWAHDGFSDETRGDYPRELLTFTRDDAKQLTRYVVRLPWARYGVKPGVLPRFGIAVFVRDIDRPDDTNGVELRWGGAARGFAPGLLKKVALASPPATLTDVAEVKSEVWNRYDAADLLVAVSPGAPVTVQVSDGKSQRTETLHAQNAIERRIIRYTPGDVTSAALTVKLARTGEKNTSETFDLLLAEPIVNELIARLQELAAGSTETLFTRHLRSIEALVQSEWAKATTYKFANTALARETLVYITSLRDAFRSGNATRAESYLRDGMPLTMAFRSNRDGTLQYYTVTVPVGYDPAKSRDEQKLFPLFLELHGAGNTHPLNGPSAYYGNTPNGGNGYETATTYACQARVGYHLFPFARGNSGYRDIGETDLWEAIADFDETFKADPNRRYLFGFSMGGAGTWSIGRETPDQWAAMSIMGAGARPEEYQARNVSNIPIRIWMGTEDPGGRRYGSSAEETLAHFKEVIEAEGGTVNASTTPNLGHRYIGETQKASYEWLQQFTRKRPDRFGFAMDDDRHPGIWGISMLRDLTISGLPHFDCVIDEQTVRITTSGTPGVRVVLGDEGLQMSGDVTLVVDDKQVYSGPATNEPITAGERPWPRSRFH